MRRSCIDKWAARSLYRNQGPIEGKDELWFLGSSYLRWG